MEFTNEFTIPVGIDEAMDVLTDLEKVAPCFPGAVLESVDGDTYSGRAKVKVGPMSLTYAGDATVTEVDRDNHTARIEAAGREKRGAGTAAADVRAELVEVEGGTSVTVVTDINITGKPAQFGRGVMADVGGKIIERFSDNLREMLEEDQAEDAPEEAVDEAAPAAAAAPSGGGPRKVAPVAPRDDALDLMDVAGEATIKRLAPVLAAALVVLLIVLLRRRSED